MNNLISIALPALLQLIADAPQIMALWNAATSNASAASKIKAVLPASAAILEQVGSILYPNLAPTLHVVAGAVTMNLNAVQWTQEAMNLLVVPSPKLKVDGLVGPKTLAAIHSFQQQHGFTLTGFLSDAEDALIMQLLAKV